VVLDSARVGANGQRDPQEQGAQAALELNLLPGYAIHSATPPISAAVTVYDPKTAQVWRVPFRKIVLCLSLV